MDKKSKFDDDDVDDDDDFFEFHENASILISTVVFSKKRYLHSDWPLIVFQPIRMLRTRKITLKSFLLASGLKQLLRKFQQIVATFFL